MYNPTKWVNHVTDQDGNVIQQGTLLDQEHFNKIEHGLTDISYAAQMLLFNELQKEYNERSELHKVTLGDTGNPWPFNNKATTIALEQNRETTNYSVEVQVLSYDSGRVGNIRVTDRALNGFKLVHDGSAKNVVVAIRVSGGMIDTKLEDIA